MVWIDDPQIRAAIISGVFGILCAAISNRKLTPPLKKFIWNEFWFRLITVVVTVIGGIIPSLISYFLIWFIFLQPCGPFSPTSVTITSPVPNDRVPNQILVQGNACHIPQGEELWLFVQPEGITGYFPQPGPIKVRDDGTWSTPAFIGQQEGTTSVRNKFTLIPALINQKDTEVLLQTYLEQKEQYNAIEWSSLGQIEWMKPISVTRR